ncbi:MAG: hypothetical protein R3A47_07055 [Polyangiales bacterium]
MFIDENDRRFQGDYAGRNGVCLQGLLAILIATPLYLNAIVSTAIFFYVLIFVFAALFVVYRQGRKVDSKMLGARLRYLAMIGGLGGLFTLIDYLPYVGLDIRPSARFVVVFVYMLSPIDLRHRLPDLYELTGRLGVLTALSLCSPRYFGYFQRLRRSFVHPRRRRRVVVLVLFDPMRALVGGWISQVFFRERFDLDNISRTSRSNRAWHRRRRPCAN